VLTEWRRNAAIYCLESCITGCQTAQATTFRAAEPASSVFQALRWDRTPQNYVGRVGGTSSRCRRGASGWSSSGRVQSIPGLLNAKGKAVQDVPGQASPVLPRVCTSRRAEWPGDQPKAALPSPSLAVFPQSSMEVLGILCTAVLQIYPLIFLQLQEVNSTIFILL
jgi:hypothetical protein